MKTYSERTYRTLEAAEAALPEYADYSQIHAIWHVTMPAQDPLWVIEGDDFWAINNAARVQGYTAENLGNGKYRVMVPGGGGAIDLDGKRSADAIVQAAVSRGYVATLVSPLKAQPLTKFTDNELLAEIKRRLDQVPR